MSRPDLDALFPVVETKRNDKGEEILTRMIRVQVASIDLDVRTEWRVPMMGAQITDEQIAKVDAARTPDNVRFAHSSSKR